jgi:hypothetical protein
LAGEPISRLIPGALFCSFCHFALIAGLFCFAFHAGMAHIDDGGEETAVERMAHVGVAVLAFPLGCLVIWAKVEGPLGTAMIVLNSLLWGFCLAWLARTFTYVPREPPS